LIFTERSASSSQQALSDRRLVADGGSRSEKSFRETVLKLSGRNSQLEDEIQTLKRDLDQALGRAKQTSKVEKDGESRVNQKLASSSIVANKRKFSRKKRSQGKTECHPYLLIK